ncbi:MAG TPA: radical SAM family heme chaperone HemW [Chloroflexi bacterium]|nr:radical SAM family heme chaperone HemW [Chloroflexota bacterium]
MMISDQTSGQMNHSLYLHIPFCSKRCSYCDFNTYAGITSLLPVYIDALCQEIVKVTSCTSRKYPVHTIFLGGGTPSLLSPEQCTTIISTIDRCFTLQNDHEYTLEANPDSLTLDKLMEYHRLGINRLSIGMQSALPHELALLGRLHNHHATQRSVDSARQAGFTNLNLDLIFNLPGQTLKDWQKSLDAALSLQPTHLSLYALSLEEGTLLHRQVEDGEFATPEDDTAAAMIDMAAQMLSTNGFIHYEVSNWAKADEQTDYTCRHNLQYWLNQPYFGFGAGAHGLVEETRTINEPLPARYIRRCHETEALSFPAGPACTENHVRDHLSQIEEHMILGLRLLQRGVNRDEFTRRFGNDWDAYYGDIIRQLLVKQQLIWDESSRSLRLPPKLFFVANQVLVQFLFDRD